MAIFTATVTAPNCQYARTAEAADADWADVIAYRRATMGQVQAREADGSPKFSETGVEIMRDISEEEIANVILGGMLQGEFAAAAAWKKSQIAENIKPATWTVTA